ncbi:esterase B1-like [Contarinia nasturtii]|uniref:esterase B1-like n=1 Tax=Contarinia nasturtii TaxID=265458 RepID=UPI0012D42FFC|nr:esterase B1-like [Contarinia nasturtii]
MLQFVILLLCSTAFVLVKSDTAPPTVITRSGEIRGQIKETIWEKRPFETFIGIPYAQPPVGDLRFKAPEPVKPWREPFNAVTPSKMCPQNAKNVTGMSEDCLYMSIHVPVVNGTRKLATLVFFHGGGYIAGTADNRFFGPDFFVENDVILVTLNFRLGVLGFMSLGLPEYSGNMGLKDQQLAMKWIYENIEAFGGDRYRITLGGLSAGGQSVGHHMLNKESQQYFNQMLSVSGTPNTVQNYQKGDHRCLAEFFYRKCHNGHQPRGDEDLIQFLKTVDMAKIILFTKDSARGYLSPWNPTVEYSNAKRPFFQDDPMHLLHNTASLNKSAYFTFTKDEHLFYAKNTNYGTPSEIKNYLNNFYMFLPIFGYSTSVAKRPYFKLLMNKVRNFYFGATTTDAERLRQRIILDSDIYCIYPIEKWMQGHIAISKKNTYYHRFSVHTKINPYDMFPGTGHADEQCYLFACSKFAELYGKIKCYKHASEEMSVAFKAMNNLHKLFSNFIKFGNPNNPNKNTDSVRDFPPARMDKPHRFYMADVTNDGIFVGIAPNTHRVKFLDSVVSEVKKLAELYGDAPKKTPIQLLCDTLNSVEVQVQSRI